MALWAVIQEYANDRGLEDQAHLVEEFKIALVDYFCLELLRGGSLPRLIVCGSFEGVDRFSIMYCTFFVNITGILCMRLSVVT